MNIVAAASAQAQLGSRLLVSLIQEQEVNFGKPFIRQRVLQMVVEVRVGKKTWNFIKSLLVPGVLTSPNYPGNYPNSVEKTETIQVENGLLVLMHFTEFDIEAQFDWDSEVFDYDFSSSFTCPFDHLQLLMVMGQS